MMNELPSSLQNQHWQSQNISSRNINSDGGGIHTTTTTTTSGPNVVMNMNSSTSTSTRSSNNSHTSDHNSSVEIEREGNIQIVRSIASYLSLSEVESIGSLYSLVSSPQPHTQTQTQMLQHQHYHHTPLGNIIQEEDDDTGNGTGTGNAILSSAEAAGFVRTGARSRDYGYEYDTTRDSEQQESASQTTIHSGPDAAAGFGSTQRIMTSTSMSAATPIDNNGDRKQSNITQDTETDYFECEGGSGDSGGLETPGLIALSPIALDEQDDEEENCNNYDKRKGQQEGRDDYEYGNNMNNQYSPPPLSLSSASASSSSSDSMSSSPTPSMKRKKYNDRLKKIQLKLQREILSHPQSIRSYCLSSHQKATEMRQREEKENSLNGVLCPDCDNVMKVKYMEVSWNGDERRRRRRRVYTCICQSPSHQPIPSNLHYQQYSNNHHQTHINNIPLHSHLFQILASPVFQNVPLSIIFDLTIQSIQTGTGTVSASFSLTCSSIKSIIRLLVQTVHKIWSSFSSSLTLNPLKLLDFFISIQQKAMSTMGIRISSEAIVTGIQSVTTLGSDIHMNTNQKAVSSGPNIGSSGLTKDGAGSVMSGSVRSGSVVTGRSNMGLSDWWRGTAGGGNSSGTRSSGRENLICEKMFRKLKKVDSAAKVIKYVEGDDEVLTHHAKKRVQKMMHYRVPLRPFVATIEVPTQNGNTKKKNGIRGSGSTSNSSAFKNVDIVKASSGDEEDSSSSFVSDSASNFSTDGSESPFMCTPKSFPPTPSSRAHVLARGTKFAQDVVFLARDQLRVQEGLYSANAQTRAMAKALHDGKRLAVFNAADVGGGINLSCGQHCASKVGNDLYCSARGMIPVLRNSFVYFEMTVTTPPLLSMMLHHASLSIGLSTLEMPLNALVGAWKGSIGLCSTGQILAGSQWCSPLEPKTYGSGSTVGCLLYLDDASAFETWDGVMVTASVVFNVDGHVVVPAGLVGQNQAASQRTVQVDDQNPLAVTNIDNSELNPVSPLFVPREEELFPTLTLHSTQTEVLCRFCASDILATSRRAIGAPNGVTVYAVDGSVLFDSETGYSEGVLAGPDVNLSNSSLQSLCSDDTTSISHVNSMNTISLP